MAMTQSFAQRHGVPNAYASTEALLANPEIDAVYVATPPSSHKPLALQAARADESLAPLIAVGADGTTISIRQVALVGRERLAGIWAWTSEQSRVHVTMPAWSRLEARMDLGSLSAKQPWEDAWVRASAGSVKLGECRTASVRADAGTVWVAALGSGEIFTQAGSVKVGTVTGAVTASASAGSVKVMEAREGSLDLRTELGSISIGVPFGTAQ